MPRSGIGLTDLHAAFRTQYELCALEPGETVALLTDPRTDSAMVDIAFGVAVEMGATVYQLHVRAGIDDRYMQSDPFKAPGLVEALSKANLVLSFFVGFFSAWEAPVRAAGGRILNVLDTPEQLVRLQTTPAVKAAVLAAGKRLGRARTIQVLSEAGTDLSWECDKDLPIVTAYGFADEPGTLAQWGQAMVACWPAEGSARGRVVVQPGDVWMLPWARRVHTPITLAVEEGYVRKVDGGVDAFAFRQALDKAKTSETDRDPYAISHLGWGLNPLAHWDDIVRFDGEMLALNTSMRSYPGNFLFSTGPGPKRKTRGHVDMPMNHCTILLDGEKVVDKGRLIAADMIVDPKRAGH